MHRNLLSLFLDAVKIYMSTVFFLAQIVSQIFCLQNAFFLTYDLNGFKSRINEYLTSLDSMKIALFYSFYIFYFSLVFLITPCFLVAVHPCMGGTPNPKKFLRNSRFATGATCCFWRNQTERKNSFLSIRKSWRRRPWKSSGFFFSVRRVVFRIITKMKHF